MTLNRVALPATARVGAAGAGLAQCTALLDVAATLQAGEIAGAMQRAFDMTLQWTADRYSFGRPLGSYQEIEHRVADLRTALEACAAIAGRAARTVGEESVLVAAGRSAVNTNAASESVHGDVSSLRPAGADAQRKRATAAPQVLPISTFAIIVAFGNEPVIPELM